jgi:hypothetical protein
LLAGFDISTEVLCEACRNAALRRGSAKLDLAEDPDEEAALTFARRRRSALDFA